MSINDLGIGKEDRKQIADGLSRYLASTYMLYTKSHNYHWNVTGSSFTALHELFEQHYTALAIAVDEVAERVRALGYKAPGTFAEFIELSVLSEDSPHAVPEAKEMVKNLEEDHEKLAAYGRSLVEISSKSGDEATSDLLTEEIKAHEKAAWMLRSHLGSASEVRPATI